MRGVVVTVKHSAPVAGFSLNRRQFHASSKLSEASAHALVFPLFFFHFWQSLTIPSLAAPAHGGVLSAHKLQRYSSIGLVALIPTALLLEPSSLVYPVDLALGFLLPLHMQLGMRDIIRDYVPNPQLAQYAMLVISVCAALGLTKLNFNGEGVTAGAKRLWRSSATSKKD